MKINILHLGTGWILLAGASGLSLAGCTSERAFGAYDPSSHTWNTASGIKVEDRVSGKLLNPEDALTLEFGGEIYYFENEFDREMFRRDPGVYDYHGYQPFYGGDD